MAVLFFVPTTSALLARIRLPGPDESDIRAEALDILPEASGLNLGSGQGGSAFIAFGNIDYYRAAVQAHIFGIADIIEAVFHRSELEVAVTARDERVLEGAGAADITSGLVGIFSNFYVINLKIGRKIDLRSLEQ